MASESIHGGEGAAIYPHGAGNPGCLCGGIQDCDVEVICCHVRECCWGYDAGISVVSLVDLGLVTFVDLWQDTY